MEQPTTTQDVNQDVQQTTTETTQQQQAVQSAEPQQQVQTQAPETLTQQPSESDERAAYADKIRQYYLQTGNLEPFLKAGSTDYTKLTPEEVLRTDLQNRYPTLSSERLDRLYRKEVLEKFSQIEGIFDDEDRELGADLMKIEAEKVRARLIDEQKEFLLPVSQSVDESKKQQEIREQWSNYVSQSDFIKSLSESKRVAIDVGGEKVNIEVDPQSVVEQTIDDQKFFKQFFDESGTLNWDKWSKVLAYASNMEAFESALVNHGKTLGSSSILEGELKNSSFRVMPSPVNKGYASDEKQKIAQAVEAALLKGR